MNKKPSPSSILAREIVLELAKALSLDHIDKIKIGVAELQSSTTITVEAHEDDHGKLVGTAGAMINSIKPLFAMIGERHGIRMRFILNKPPRLSTAPRAPFQADPNWDNEKIRALLERFCRAMFWKPVKVQAIDAGDTTTLEILPASDEPALRNAQALEAFLRPMFHAIGKSQGRNEVFLDLAKTTA